MDILQTSVKDFNRIKVVEWAKKLKDEGSVTLSWDGLTAKQKRYLLCVVSDQGLSCIDDAIKSNNIDLGEE